MKKIATFCIRCIICTVFLISSFTARASHIVGADLSYQHVSGLTYKITVVLYGDCGPSSRAAFGTLPTSSPLVCVFNGTSSISSLSLVLDSSQSFIDITPLCSGDSSQCTNPSSAIRGIERFVYTRTYTLPSRSSIWRFIYSGNDGAGSAAGRAAAITNLIAPGSTIMQLIDTLNNASSDNTSPDLIESTPTYFLDSVANIYSPLAVDPDGDSLSFSLIAATNGTEACGAVGGPVFYTATPPAWTPPYTLLSAATPLIVEAGSFSFDNTNGSMSFFPVAIQRAVVVYNIREYRGGVLVGTSQREMTFQILSSGATSSTPCFGSVYAGYTNVASTCAGIPDTLSLSDHFAGCGISFQWQSSTTGSSWTNIPGATNDTFIFSPTSSDYYRCALTCSFSSLAGYSLPVLVPVSTAGLLHSNITTPLDTACNGPQFYVFSCGSSSAYHVSTYYGDGSNDDHALTTVAPRHVNFAHTYAAPGTYTVKEILFDGTSRVDSLMFSYEYLYCRTLPVKFYYDANSDCVFDSGDSYSYIPVNTEVDSNGTPIDTISAVSGFYYKAYGPAGTVYAFRPISPIGGMSVICPSSGVLYDTIAAYADDYVTRYFGLNCASGTSFDLGEYASFRPGPHNASATIIAHNAYCTPETGTLTMTFSPKYTYVSAAPTPLSVSGNVLTWVFDSLSAVLPPRIVNVSLYKATVLDIPIGDTVNSSYVITPITGDVNPGNNSTSTFDSVRASYDPNEMSVTPSGFIASGTRLQYSITFENTGNAPARNIYVMDTLSDDLVLNSLRVVASSAIMNVSRFNDGARNIVKFDFPNINLPDSSHHNHCEGLVIFNIDTKNGLSPGTTIPNHAGIFFDDNAVVLTDTVKDIIASPPSLHSSAVTYGEVSIFPNPATNQLTINTAGSGYTSFSIVNTIGSELIHQPLSSSHTVADIKALPAGMYYVIVKGDAGSVVKKFIKM